MDREKMRHAFTAIKAVCDDIGDNPADYGDASGGMMGGLIQALDYIHATAPEATAQAASQEATQ